MARYDTSSSVHGVDFSNFKRHSAYATPRTPTYQVTSTGMTTGTSTASPITSPRRASSRIPMNVGSVYTSSAARPNTPGSNAGRKRSRLSAVSATTMATAPSAPALKARAAAPTVTCTSTLSPPPSMSTGDYAMPGYFSPAPLANSRYSLAGGFDTPTARTADAYDRPTYSAEADRSHAFRRLRDDEVDRPTYAHGLGGMRDIAGPLSRGQNGADGVQDGFGTGEDDDEDNGLSSTRRVPTGSDPEQWSMPRALLSTVASAAGIVFHFCTAGAFKGFSAGGGQGWTMRDGRAVADEMGKREGEFATGGGNHDAGIWEDSWQDADSESAASQNGDPGGNIGGGAFSYFEPSSAWPPPRSATGTPGTPPRAAKKVKTSVADDGGSGMRGSWILVGPDGSGGNSPRPSSPFSSAASPAGLRRKTAFGPTAVGHGGTPVSGRHRRRFTAGVSMSVGPGGVIAGGARSGVQASSAALRSPGAASREGRRSRAGSIRAGGGFGAGAGAGLSPMTPTRGSGAQQRESGGAANASANASASAANTSATAAVTAATASAATDSPLGREGERLIRMKNRMEREEDREIMRMNRRLEEMIRQGREALGTRYEVELENEDVGSGGGEGSGSDREMLM